MPCQWPKTFHRLYHDLLELMIHLAYLGVPERTRRPQYMTLTINLNGMFTKLTNSSYVTHN